MGTPRRRRTTDPPAIRQHRQQRTTEILVPAKLQRDPRRRNKRPKEDPTDAQRDRRPSRAALTPQGHAAVGEMTRQEEVPRGRPGGCVNSVIRGFARKSCSHGPATWLYDWIARYGHNGVDRKSTRLNSSHVA